MKISAYLRIPPATEHAPVVVIVAHGHRVSLSRDNVTLTQNSDAVAASYTTLGITAQHLMSAFGQKQTWRRLNAMFPLPPKADMNGCQSNVRFVPIADMTTKHPY
jgi:hypothetical protein